MRELDFMRGAEIGGWIAAELRRQGFRPSRHLPERLWVRGRRHGRRHIVFLDEAGSRVTVLRLNGRAHISSHIDADDPAAFALELLKIVRQ